MTRYIKKIFIRTQLMRRTNSEGDQAKKKSVSLSRSLEENLVAFQEILGNSNDIIIKEFNFGFEKEAKGALIFVEGLADKAILDSSILKTLMYRTSTILTEDISNMDFILETLLPSSSIKKIALVNDLLDELLSGITLLLVDGSIEALAINAKKYEKRNIEAPQTESVVRGSREGFTESLLTNSSLLRRRIKSPDLRIESYTIGEKTGTKVSIVYLKNVVNPKIVTELKKRLSRIQTDAILESGYIEAYIEDAPFSIFPTVGNSEKPDVVAAKVLEGRIAILVDGTPFVLTVPMLFVESFQVSEDYYSRPYFASLIRMLRYLSYIITTLAPAIYVALTMYHQELIPSQLLFTMAADHSGIAFPSIVEAGIMLVIFDILREAGVRLPKAVGSAVSIVGALVLGESAVSAGIITAFVVIVISITAISGFVIPAQTDSMSILRYFFLLTSGFMGVFGIIMGGLIVFIHLTSLRSFGTPYLSPVAPFVLKDMKDTFVRMPLWSMLTRPKNIGEYNPNRQTKSKMKPSPPDEN